MVHLDPHGTATQKHSAVHSFLGGSVVRRAEELCLSGHNKKGSFKTEIASNTSQCIASVNQDNVALDKSRSFIPQ